MTGNIGIHGGDAAGRAWESVMPGYPYPIHPMRAMRYLMGRSPNKAVGPDQGEAGLVMGQITPSFALGVHSAKLADAILKGKAGGYPADYKLLYVAFSNYLTQWPNVNKIMQTLNKLEFIAVQEQFMTPTAKFADILLPVNTYMERNDVTVGVGAKTRKSLGNLASHRWRNRREQGALVKVQKHGRVCTEGERVPCPLGTEKTFSVRGLPSIWSPPVPRSGNAPFDKSRLSGSLGAMSPYASYCRGLRNAGLLIWHS